MIELTYMYQNQVSLSSSQDLFTFSLFVKRIGVFIWRMRFTEAWMLFLFLLNTAHYIYVKTWFCSLGALSLFLYFNQREALLPLHEKRIPEIWGDIL